VTELLGFAAGTLTTVAFLPQMIQSLRTGSVRDLSLGMLLIFNAGMVLWVAYGLAITALPVVIADSITLLLSGVLLALKVRNQNR
jgi:MtN3 and saliva related transmembrane protein